jgi:hypothetical protein
MANDVFPHNFCVNFKISMLQQKQKGKFTVQSMYFKYNWKTIAIQANTYITVV